MISAELTATFELPPSEPKAVGRMLQLHEEIAKCRTAARTKFTKTNPKAGRGKRVKMGEWCAKRGSQRTTPPMRKIREFRKFSGMGNASNDMTKLLEVHHVSSIPHIQASPLGRPPARCNRDRPARHPADRAMLIIGIIATALQLLIAVTAKMPTYYAAPTVPRAAAVAAVRVSTRARHNADSVRTLRQRHAATQPWRIRLLPGEPVVDALAAVR